MAKEKGRHSDIAEAMVATPLLQGLPGKAVRGLADEGRLRSYRKGTYLCHQGDPADEVFFLVSGRMEIASLSVTGNRILHATVDTPGVRRGVGRPGG